MNIDETENSKFGQTELRDSGKKLSQVQSLQHVKQKSVQNTGNISLGS